MALTLNNVYSTYQWSTGSTESRIEAFNPGAWIVTVTDVNGCRAEAEYSLTESPIPRASIQGDSLITCVQSFARLQADSSLLNASLAWYNPRGDLIGEALSVAVAQPGVYILRASDATGTCATTDSFEVALGQEVPELSLNRPDPITCRQTEVELPVDVLTNNMGLSVRWYGPSLVSGVQSLSPVVNRAGLYRIVVTDTLTGCYATAGLRVREDRQPPLVGVGGVPRLECVSGEAVLQATSPDATVRYQWQTTEGLIIGADDQSQVRVGEIGWYELTVTDLETGCTTPERIYVGEPDAPRDVIARAIPTCENEAKGYVIVDRISGGTPPFVYSLNGAPTDERGSYTDLDPGTYQLDIIDSEGCDYTTFLEVEALPVPQTVYQADICEGLTYFWKGREYNQAGRYIDTLVAANGCDSLDVLELRVNPTNLVERRVDLCEGDVFQIGGLSFTEAGAYTVVIPDSVICDSVVRLEIVVHPVDTLFIQGPEFICEGDSVELQAVGDFTDFNWSNGVQGADIFVTAGGSYLLTATDDQGCRRTAEYQLVERETPVAEITGDAVITCLEPAFFLDASGTTERSNISINWYGGNRQLIGSDPLLQISEPGLYYLDVRDTQNGCAAFDSLLVEEGRSFPEIAVNGEETLTCLENAINLEAELFGDLGAVSITWNGPGILAGADALTPRIDAPGAYRIEVRDNSSGCAAQDSVRVTDGRELPPVALGESAALDCNTGQTTLDALIVGGQYVFQWTSNAGPITGMQNAPEVTVTQPGRYVVEVRNEENGCTARDTVTVLASDGPRGVEALIDPSCAEISNGRLAVEQVIGGTAPFVFFLNGRPYSDLTNFRQLTGGDYEFAIEDAAGCLWDTLIAIPQLPPLTVELDVDLQIELGDSVYLLPSVNIPRSEIAEISWTPGEGLSCTNCLDPTAAPEASTEYLLEIVDINGCRGSDVARIAVDGDYPIFIPDGFSPNGDGVNDRFTIFGSDRVARVRELRIFSRWGEMVFFAEDIPPNEPAFGWDGKLDGQDMNSAVFVYFTVVELFNGREVILKGDLTLVR